MEVTGKVYKGCARLEKGMAEHFLHLLDESMRSSRGAVVAQEWSFLLILGMWQCVHKRQNVDRIREDAAADHHHRMCGRDAEEALHYFDPSSPLPLSSHQGKSEVLIPMCK